MKKIYDLGCFILVVGRRRSEDHDQEKSISVFKNHVQDLAISVHTAPSRACLIEPFALSPMITYDPHMLVDDFIIDL